MIIGNRSVCKEAIALDLRLEKPFWVTTWVNYRRKPARMSLNRKQSRLYGFRETSVVAKT